MLVEAPGDGPRHGHPPPLVLVSLDQGCLTHRYPPPGGREPPHQLLTSSRYFHLQPLPPGREPPPVPLRARVGRGWLAKKQDPGEGHHLVDEMANYVALGWKPDLIHIIRPPDCLHWSQWTEVKELMPLKYMPYMARLFHEVIGRDLQGLDQFTRWIGLGGYYHWRVVQQGLIHHVPRLQDEPRLRTPKSHPSGRPLIARPSSTETLATGALVGPLGGVQPTPQGGGPRPASNQGGGSRPTSNQGGGQRPTSNQGGSVSTPSQSRRPTTSSQGGRSSAPHQSATPATSGAPTDQPSGSMGAGDSTWASWYQITMRESGGGISKPQGPPFLIASAQVRQESVSQIYG